MKGLWPKERVTDGFERIVLSVAQVLLMVMVALTVFDLVFLLVIGIATNLATLDSIAGLQQALQRSFAGILLLLIGLELLATLRVYLHDHNFRLEVVLVVALIAIGRHVIQIDIGHTDGMTLVGIAILTLALATGYYLVRRVAPEAARPVATSPTVPGSGDTPR